MPEPTTDPVQEPEQDKKALLKQLQAVCAVLSAEIDEEGRAGAGAVTAEAARLGEDDMLVHYDISLHRAAGQTDRVRGHFVMSNLMNDEMLPEAFINFENSFHALVARPLTSVFLKRVRQKIDSLPEDSGARSTGVITTEVLAGPDKHAARRLK